MFLGLKVSKSESEQLNEKNKIYSIVSPDSKGSVKFLFNGNRQIIGCVLGENHRLSLRSLMRLITAFKEMRYRKLPCCSPIVVGERICTVSDEKLIHFALCNPDKFDPDIVRILPYCRNCLTQLRLGDRETYRQLCERMKNSCIRSTYERLCAKLTSSSFLNGLYRFTVNTIVSYDSFEMETILITFETIVRNSAIFPMEESESE